MIDFITRQNNDLIANISETPQTSSVSAELMVDFLEVSIMPRINSTALPSTQCFPFQQSRNNRKS